MWTFGAGVLVATPTNAADGTAIALPSPIQFGVVQEVQVDQEFEEKLLYGANQFPVDQGRGKGKNTIKCKNANINAELCNAVFFGETPVAGYGAIYQDLVGTLIPGTGGVNYSINVVPPNSGVYARDLGVQDGVNGIPFTRISPTGTPTGNQYLVTAGTGATGSVDYVFSDIDHAAGARAFINYAYTNASSPASAKVTTQVNRPMGYMPFFALDFMAQKNGKTRYIRFPRCSSTKISSQFKNDDFTIPEFDIQAIADANNVVAVVYDYE